VDKVGVTLFDGDEESATGVPSEWRAYELHLADLIDGRVIEHALFASFGVHYGHLHDTLLGGRDYVPGQICVVDNDNTRQFDAGLIQTGNAARPFDCVYPPRFHGARGVADLQQVEKGCMHPKLMLMVCETADRRWLRVVISSANIGNYDAAVNNIIWVQDFEPKSERALRDGTPEPACSEFAEQMLDFVQRLLSVPDSADARRLQGKWRTLLRQFDLAVPPGLRLVASVPGTHSFRGVRSGGGGSDRGGVLYGSARLGACLGEAHVPPAARVEIIASSTGQSREAEMRTLFEALGCGCVDGREAREEGCGLGERGRELARRVSEAMRRLVQVVWPTIEYALDAEANSDSGGGFGLGDSRAEMLRGCQLGPEAFKRMREYFAAFDAHLHRVHAGNHCKMIVGLDKDGRQLWVYMGSANLSGAAWGRVCARRLRSHALCPRTGKSP
jgi:hypothetical protein